MTEAIAVGATRAEFTDSHVPADFTELLESALAALPDDWDILHLHGCNVKASKQAVRQNIYVNHQSSCTLAYAFRQRFALEVSLTSRS